LGGVNIDRKRVTIHSSFTAALVNNSHYCGGIYRRIRFSQTTIVSSAALGSMGTALAVTKLTGPCCLTDAERHVCHFSPKQQVVTLPSLSVIYRSLRDKHAALITQVSSPSLHELMSTNIRSFHVHFLIGTLCLLKPVSSTRCLQASQLMWSTKPCHSSGKGRPSLLDIYQRTEEELFYLHTSILLTNYCLFSDYNDSGNYNDKPGGMITNLWSHRWFWDHGCVLIGQR